MKRLALAVILLGLAACTNPVAPPVEEEEEEIVCIDPQEASEIDSTGRVIRCIPLWPYLPPSPQ